MHLKEIVVIHIRRVRFYPIILMFCTTPGTFLFSLLFYPFVSFFCNHIRNCISNIGNQLRLCTKQMATLPRRRHCNLTRIVRHNGLRLDSTSKTTFSSMHVGVLLYYLLGNSSLESVYRESFVRKEQENATKVK